MGAIADQIQKERAEMVASLKAEILAEASIMVDELDTIDNVTKLRSIKTRMSNIMKSSRRETGMDERKKRCTEYYNVNRERLLEAQKKKRRLAREQVNAQKNKQKKWD